MISTWHFLFASAFVGLVIDFAIANSIWILGEKELPPEAVLYKSFISKVQGGENVTYQLTSGGSLDLVLKSDSGDADIYVGSKYRPTTEEYDICSVTCAMDTVHIENDLPRPVHISIFGNPYHDTTEFTLDVYLVPPKVTYEDIYRSHESPSYEDLVYEHVQLRDEHLRGIGGEGRGQGSHYGGGGRQSSSSNQRRSGGQGRGDGRGGSGGSGSGGGDIDEDQSWFDWVVEGDEGWVAVITIVTGILKVILQVLG